MFSGRSDLRGDYLQMVVNGKCPKKDSPLVRQLENNPKLLQSDVKPFDPICHRSVITMTMGGGNLRAADLLLKQDDRVLIKSNPFYCGKVSGGISSLLSSASINFYCALIALQYYSQQGKLAELVDIGSGAIKKTHYDCLYWEDTEGKRHPDLLEVDENISQAQIDAYQRKTARFFMTIAYEAFQAETQLHTRMTPAEKARAHSVTGNCYLRIALIEDYSRYAFYYYLDKALEHYRAASCASQVVYIEDCIARREELFESQGEKYNAQLYVEATESYRLRSPEEWQTLYLDCEPSALIESDAFDDASYPETNEETPLTPSTLRHREITRNPLAFAYKKVSTCLTPPSTRRIKGEKNS